MIFLPLNRIFVAGNSNFHSSHSSEKCEFTYRSKQELIHAVTYPKSC